MIILGVDPGTLTTGFSIVEFSRGRTTLLACDVIRNRSSRSMPLRLKTIYDALCDAIDRYRPDEFAIETAFYGKNAQSALKLGHARGVSILAAVNRQLPTAEYSPREVKKAVVGNGAASKEQVRYMLKSRMQLATLPKLFDATDALAVALCHLQRTTERRSDGRTKRSESWKAFAVNNPERVIRQK